MMDCLIRPFRYLFFLMLIMVYGETLQAQVSPNLGNTSRLMTQATTAMEEGEFEKANAIFHQIIQSNAPIPSEMPYFFAETLYELKQYDNSSNFLGKYLDLNGFKGQHYKEAKALERKLEEPLKEISACQFCDKKGYRLLTCTTCSGEKQVEQDCTLCKAQGIVGCSRCAGQGIVTKKNVFNILEYYDCERCSGAGRLTCPRCEGTHLEYGECRTCAGTGHLESEELCNHQESQSIGIRRTSFRNVFGNNMSHLKINHHP
ncbi:molecular chaperone DnaJ [Lunatibacter salilacus]|uniref:molecular chaperone DnaJ n=1 Tax=Lunatibacter salilacus TaxID=2483804 RepID=UPI0018FE8FD2|nr:molecular chaperone DnaJ [Lunatibacter salilacus]